MHNMVEHCIGEVVMPRFTIVMKMVGENSEVATMGVGLDHWGERDVM